MGEIGDPNRLDRHVGIARDLGVDRHEEVVALVLHAATGEIDEGLHVRADRRRLVEKVAHRHADRLLVEVARPHDVEAGRLKGLGDQRGVVDRRGEGLVAVGRFADHQGDARVGWSGLRQRRWRRPYQQARCEHDECRSSEHLGPPSRQFAPPIRA